MKKVIFLVERSNDLRFFASVIDTFKKKKIIIEIFYLNLLIDKNNFKYYLNPLNIKSNIIKNISIKKFNDKMEFHDYFLKEEKNISFLFSLTFLSKKRFVITSEFLRAVDRKWCIIGHGMDSFSQLREEDTYLDYASNFFFTSEFFYKEGKKYIKKFVKSKSIFDTKKLKTYIVGNTMFSKKIFKKKINKNKINKKKKLIYLPFPFLKERYGKDFAFQAAFSGQYINYYSFLTKIHKRKSIEAFLLHIKHIIINNLEILKYFSSIKEFYFLRNELNIIKSIRNFCDKNNYEFIVKPRLKFPYISQLEKYADRIIYDDESIQYPTLLQKEMASTNIIIGSLSSTVYESAMFKIPYINLEIPKIAFKTQDDKFFYNYKKSSYYNYDGVVFNFKLNKFISTFENKKEKFFNLNIKNNLDYLKKYCGLNKNNKSSGERIFKILNNKKK